jgi:hypothetical protein
VIERSSLHPRHLNGHRIVLRVDALPSEVVALAKSATGLLQELSEYRRSWTETCDQVGHFLCGWNKGQDVNTLVMWLNPLNSLVFVEPVQILANLRFTINGALSSSQVGFHGFRV